MKPIPVILLCLMLSACASQQYVKPTVLPEITISYEAELTDEEKASLNKAIMEAISCDLFETTVNIIVKEYYEPETWERFVGRRPKGIKIRAYVKYQQSTKNPSHSI